MQGGKVKCPMCGVSVSVSEGEPDELGCCPDCGAVVDRLTGEFEVTAPASPQGTGEEDAALLALLSEGSEEGNGADLEPETPPAAAPPGELDYRLWQGVAEQAGDWAMAVRLDSWRRAAQAGWDMGAAPSGSGPSLVEQMILAEAAVAAFQSQTEAEWREDWIRRLVKVAAKWGDEATADRVAAVLSCTSAVAAELKKRDLWPWS